MSDFGVKFIQLTNMNPTFKGVAVALVGLMALFFAYWMRARWREPLKGGFLVFIGFSIFVILFGLYILLLQPRWWQLPY